LMQEEEAGGGGCVFLDGLAVQRAREELECDVLAQSAMVSDPDFAHRTAPEQADELVFSGDDAPDVGLARLYQGLHQGIMLAPRSTRSRYD